jgi:hypothetical protein
MNNKRKMKKKKKVQWRAGWPFDMAHDPASWAKEQSVRRCEVSWRSQ